MDYLLPSLSPGVSGMEKDLLLFWGELSAGFSPAWALPSCCKVSLRGH